MKVQAKILIPKVLQKEIFEVKNENGEFVVFKVRDTYTQKKFYDSVEKVKTNKC